MRVSKIYPQVRNGTFEIDLQFIGAEPADLQRGQTVQARLTLGAPAQARMIPNGSFYNDTGGAWVFVVSPDGTLGRAPPGPARPPQQRFHRGARRARRRASASSPLLIRASSSAIG